MIGELLPGLADGHLLSVDEMKRALEEVIEGTADPVEVAAFLTALRVRGETAEELAGAAMALRERAVHSQHRARGLVDTCGTGGAHVPTFNVSTAAALVVSACGVPVAKHGNRSFSSPSGSADVLAALGVRLDASRATVSRCLDDIGIAFFFAPLWHPAMHHVAPIRRVLRFRTLFNLAGPLANPAGVDFQLMGVGRLGWVSRMAQAARRLGLRRAAVVCSEDGLDEVSLSARTHVTVVSAEEERAFTWTAADFGLPASPLTDLEVTSAEQSAAMIQRVLDGEQGAARDLTLANASAALWVCGAVSDLQEGVARAADAIDAGRAIDKLQALIARTRDDAAESTP